MAIKKYYKVITLKHRRLSRMCVYKSAMVSDPQFCVTYDMGKWTYPNVKGTKLFVFDNLKSALRFSCTRHSVYEVEVKNPKPLKSYSLFNWSCSYCNWKVVLKMLSLRKRKKKFMYLRINESGVKNTVVVDAVKLIKQVNKY